MQLTLTVVGREAENVKSELEKIMSEAAGKLRAAGHKITHANVVANTDNEKEVSDGSHHTKPSSTGKGN